MKCEREGAGREGKREMKSTEGRRETDDQLFNSLEEFPGTILGRAVHSGTQIDTVCFCVEDNM